MFCCKKEKEFFIPVIFVGGEEKLFEKAFLWNACIIESSWSWRESNPRQTSSSNAFSVRASTWFSKKPPERKRFQQGGGGGGVPLVPEIFQSMHQSLCHELYLNICDAYNGTPLKRGFPGKTARA